jgi:hypothetical protein
MGDADECADDWNAGNKSQEWRNLSDDGLKLRCGEMTSQEIRTIRAVLNAFAPKAEIETSKPTAERRAKVLDLIRNEPVRKPSES